MRGYIYLDNLGVMLTSLDVNLSVEICNILYSKIQITKYDTINNIKYSQVLNCAGNWIKEFASDRYKFTINTVAPKIKLTLNQNFAIKI